MGLRNDIPRNKENHWRHDAAYCVQRVPTDNLERQPGMYNKILYFDWLSVNARLSTLIKRVLFSCDFFGKKKTVLI